MRRLRRVGIRQWPRARFRRAALASVAVRPHGQGVSVPGPACNATRHGSEASSIPGGSPVAARPQESARQPPRRLTELSPHPVRIGPACLRRGVCPHDIAVTAIGTGLRLSAPTSASADYAASGSPVDGGTIPRRHESLTSDLLSNPLAATGPKRRRAASEPSPAQPRARTHRARRGASRAVRAETADGTATAGDDYTETRGTLTFAAGETEKTVSVAVIDDGHDEDEETMTLRLSNPTGAYIADGEAVGTISNSDAIPKAWLARFGRTVADHVVDAVAGRLAEPAGGSQVTVAGQRLPLDGTGADTPVDGAGAGAARDEREAAEGLAALADRIGGDGDAWTRWTHEGQFTDGETRNMTGREALLGSSFRLALGGGEDGAAEAGTAFTAWGGAAASRFDGEADGLVLDGDVTTFTLGADAAWSRWLAGVAVSLSEGTGSFRDHQTTDHESRGSGTLESSLTSVHPYARLEVSVHGNHRVGSIPERWTRRFAACHTRVPTRLGNFPPLEGCGPCLGQTHRRIVPDSVVGASAPDREPLNPHLRAPRGDAQIQPVLVDELPRPLGCLDLPYRQLAQGRTTIRTRIGVSLPDSQEHPKVVDGPLSKDAGGWTNRDRTQNNPAVEGP